MLLLALVPLVFLPAHREGTDAFPVLGVFLCRRNPMSGFAPREVVHHIAHVRTLLKKLKVASKSLVELERRAADDIAQSDLENALASGSPKYIAQSLKKLSVKNQNKKPKACKVVKDDGTICSSVREEKEMVRAHFAQQLGGSPTSFEDPVIKDFQHYYNTDPSIPDISKMSYQDFVLGLPSFTQAAAYFATRKPNGVGEDTITGGIPARFPWLMTVLYHPLYLKAFVRLAPPLQWEGGQILELFKNKGSSSCVPTIGIFCSLIP